VDEGECDLASNTVNMYWTSEKLTFVRNAEIIMIDFKQEFFLYRRDMLLASVFIVATNQPTFLRQYRAR
jgi:hypothetical protein